MNLWTAYKITLPKDNVDNVQAILQSIQHKGEYKIVLTERFNTTAEVWFDTTYPRHILNKAFEGYKLQRV